jgi:ParB-like chromosome segregation protein Spo0J
MTVHMEIKQVAIGQIDPNPYRDLATYPWIERKVEQLRHSIADVGFWASVIGRPSDGKRYQIAFGHHRVEAARRNGETEIPLIVQDLTDQQMLQFMGRENGEDYNADFLVMLNTWEAAVRFAAHVPGSRHAIDIARLLGWTASSITSRNDEQMNHTAKACNAAAALIAGGHERRERFVGMVVRDVENICVAAYNRIQRVEALGKENKATAKEIETAKRQISKAIGKTAEDLKEGKITHRDLRSSLDVNTYRFAREARVSAPLFAAFGKTLIEQIERTLNTDSIAEKLAEVRKALPDLTENDDRQMVEKLELALGQLAGRAADWRKRLIHPKVVPLAPVTGKGA